jgi:diguanylate cyclase (GGDEF)-like protein/PAS domain S-box-containing protein
VPGQHSITPVCEAERADDICDVPLVASPETDCEVPWRLRGLQWTARLDSDVWEALLEPNPAPMAVYELSTLTVVAVNAAAREMYGFDRDVSRGMAVLDLFPPSEVELRRRELVSGSEEVLGRPRIVRQRLADGRLADMQVTSRPILWYEDAARIVTMTDVSRQRQAEAELAAETARLQRVVTLQTELAEAGPDVDRSLRLVASGIAELVEAANCSVWWADCERLVARATAGSPPTYSVGDSVSVEGSLAGTCFSSQQLAYIEDTATHSDYTRALAARTGIGSLVMVPLVHNGETLGALGVSAPSARAFSPAALETLRLVAGLAAGAVQRAEAHDRMAYAATHDALTGLSNRIHFTERLEHAIAIAQRQGSNVGLLYIDLDGFKAINDNLGHQCGDQVLVEVSNRILTAIREVDTVARLGGDEFAVVLSNVSVASDLSDAAQRILTALEAPVLTSNEAVCVEVSIGAALTGPEQHSGAELLTIADARMYRAKAVGSTEDPPPIVIGGSSAG